MPHGLRVRVHVGQRPHPVVIGWRRRWSSFGWRFVGRRESVCGFRLLVVQRLVGGGGAMSGGGSPPTDRRPTHRLRCRWRGRGVEVSDMRDGTFRALFLALGGAVLATGACKAQETNAEGVPTRIMIRAVSRDAKIIGSGVGGALVRVSDASTGEVLAEGLQEGGTGDTELIMSTPHRRGASIYDTEGAAGFMAELGVSEPTVVNISAMGPLDYPQASYSASKQLLVIPGAHVEGDGVILELHGFIVEILEPEPYSAVGSEVLVRARARMMCGCPITPGGLWDANTKKLVARLRSDGRVVAEAPLRYAGEPSTFRGTLAVPGGARDGGLQLEVLAAEPSEENFGRHVISLGG